MHQPKLLQQQTISFHNQLHPTISFGGITHQITPQSHHRANMFKAPKANSYAQPALPANNKKSAQKHADSEKFSAPKIQHTAFPLNTNHAPSTRDVQAAVSKWLATSQEFEKPPAQAPIADPAPVPERRGRDFWLQISTDLDRRLEACSEGGKAPIKLRPSSGCANHGVDCNISHLRWSEIRKFEREKQLTPRNECNSRTKIAVPLSPVTMGAPENQKGERKDSTESRISEVKEKLVQNKREPRIQEQPEVVKENIADKAMKMTSKQLEVAKPNKTNDDAVKAKEKKEQPEAAEPKKANEAATVRAKAKKLAADAMVRPREEQERKKYVEERAQDIHENLLQCRPFDIDAVRREFSEKEVRDIKEMVRALGFAKMR